MPLAIVLAVALVASGVGFAYLKLRHRGTEIGLITVSQRTVPWAQQIAAGRNAPEMPLLHEGEEEPEQEPIGEPLGVLISRGGRDLGSEYTVGGTPVSIGSGARCGVRIDDPEMAAEEARTWVRGGHLMVHRMTRLSVIAADGTSGGWLILEPGDTFTIGEHTFEFRMIEQASPTAFTEPTPIAEPLERGDVPNVLRDPNELGHFAPSTESRLRLTEMMPSSELAPSASYDDEPDD
jgi:hypothetical protein